MSEHTTPPSVSEDSVKADAHSTAEDSRCAAEELKAAIEQRLGFFPPYFAHALEAPRALHSFWGETLSGYLENPLPDLFREKLQARLARFCSVASALVLHTTRLRRMGLSAAEVLDVLESPIPAGDAELQTSLKAIEDARPAAEGWPADDRELETHLMRCALFLFVHTARSGRAQAAVAAVLGPELCAQLIRLLASTRAYHLWVESYQTPNVESVPEIWGPFVSILRESPKLARVFRDFRERRPDKPVQAAPGSASAPAAESGETGEGTAVELSRAVEMLKEEISRRRLIECDYLATERRYQALFAATRDLVFTCDASGKVVSANEAAVRETGYERGELLALDLEALVYSADVAAARRMLEDCSGSQTPVSGALTLMRRDGRCLHLEIEIQPAGATPPELCLVGRLVHAAEAEQGDADDTSLPPDAPPDEDAQPRAAEAQEQMPRAGDSGGAAALSDPGKAGELLAAAEELATQLSDRNRFQESLRDSIAEAANRSAELLKTLEALSTRMRAQEEAVAALLEGVRAETRAEGPEAAPGPQRNGFLARLHLASARPSGENEAHHRGVDFSARGAGQVHRRASRGQLLEAERTLECLRGMLAEAEARRLELAKLNDGVLARAASLETDLRERETALAALEAAERDARARVVALEASLVESREERNELSRRLDGAEELLSGFRARVQPAEDSPGVQPLTPAQGHSAGTEAGSCADALLLELRNLEDEKKSVAQQLQDAEERVAAAGSQVAELQDQISGMQAERGALQFALAEERRAAEELRPAAAAAQSRIAALETQLAQRDAEKAALTRELSDTEDLYNDARLKLVSQQDRIHTAEKACELLELAKAAAETRCNELASAQESLQARCTGLDEQLAQQNETLESLRAAEAEARSRLEELETALGKRGHEKLLLSKGLAHAQGCVRELEARVAWLQAQCDSAENARNALKKSIAETEAAKAGLAESCEKLQREAESLRDQIHGQQQAMDALQAAQAEAHTLAARLEAELEKKKSDNTRLRSELADAEAGRKALESERASFAARLQAAEQAESDLRGALAAAEAGRKALESERASLAARLQAAEQAESDLRGALADAEAEGRELRQAMQALRAREAQLVEECRTAGAALQQSERSKRELSERCQSLASELSSLESGLGERERTVEDLRRALAETESRLHEEIGAAAFENEQLRSRIARNIQEIQSLRRTLSESEELRGAQTKVLEDCRAELADRSRAEQALRAAAAEAQTACDEALKNRAELVGRLERTAAALEESRASLGESRARLTQLQSSNAALETMLQEHGRQLESLRSARSAAEERFGSRMAELSQLILSVQEDFGGREPDRLQAAATQGNQSETGSAAAVETIARLRGEVERYERRMHLLGRLETMLNASLDRTEAAAVIRQFAGQLFPDSAGSFWLADSDRKTMTLTAEWGGAVANMPSFPLEDCIALRRNAAHEVSDSAHALLCRHLPGALPPGYVCIPIIRRTRVLGLLHLSRTAADPAQGADASFAAIVAECLAMGLPDAEARDVCAA